MTGDWRKPHGELLNCLSSPNITKEIKRNGAGEGGGTFGEDERCIQAFGGETLMQEPSGRPRCNGRNIVPDHTGNAGTG